MWKQFLSKLPRKSSKSDASSGSDSHPSNDCTGPLNGNPIQRTSSGNVVPSRSTTVKRTASAIFPSSVVTSIEPLLLFKDVPNSQKQNLFISKLNLCCVVFDFSDPNKNSTEKDMKRQALLGLIDYVDAGASRFTEPMISACCKMFAVNLFRAFPPNTQSCTGGGENEEEEPIFDPAWCHLQLVYDLLLKFVESSSLDAKIGKKYVDISFIVRLLDLFDSEDPRERDCLKTILHRIYGKFMVHRPFIRKAVSNIFYRFVFEADRHNGIAELLEVFGSVISGFALPLKEEHRLFFQRVLIPLHKPKTLGVYLQQLTYCVTQFIEKEPKMACSIIKGLVRYWPVTNSQKEVMFLSELEEVLEATDTAELQNCMVPLFQRIGFSINSSHFQVAERALFLLNNDHVISLVSQNRQAIMPLVLPALERNTRSHWNQAVINLSQNVKNMLSEMDEEIFLACKKELGEEEEKRRIAEEKRKMIWEHLEGSAALQPVTGNTAVMVMPTVAPPITAALT
ncbi:serine/threonine protein phosphatase 2A 57 kDa regulatory subunit B' kappa isoform [Musa acuminata AAA Group]|uniref:serine/threonine protein phosphatase 2A 57 kDa regulatory subunit B' kappa isoform n=1 Tax=Musa acuminata AAA Group TaxID=214697 RepID=UPI0031DA44A5